MLFSFSLFLFSFSLLLSLLLIIWSKPAAAFLLLSLSRASTWFPFCSAEPTHSSHLSPSVTSSGTSSTSPACMHTRYRSPIDQPSLRHRISTVPMHHQLLLATRYTCRRSHVTRRLPTSAEPPCSLRLLTYKGQPEPALPSSIISLPSPCHFPSLRAQLRRMAQVPALVNSVVGRATPCSTNPRAKPTSNLRMRPPVSHASPSSPIPTVPTATTPCFGK